MNVSVSSDNSPMYVPIRIRQQKDLEIKLNYQLEIRKFFFGNLLTC